MLKSMGLDQRHEKARIRCTCGAYDNYFDNKKELK